MIRLCLCLLMCHAVALGQTPPPKAEPIPKNWNELAYRFDTRYIQLEHADVQMAYTETGSGPHTLVFIHGTEGYMPLWQKNIMLLRREFRCVALDLPGYGKSSKQLYPMQPTWLAQAVLNLMNKLGIKQAVLVGHDLGAAAAVQLAHDHPKRVSHLVLLAPQGLETLPPSVVQTLKTQHHSERFVQMSEDSIKGHVKRQFFRLSEDAQFLVRDRLAMRKMPGFGYYAQNLQASYTRLYDYPMLAQVQKLKQPTLLLLGLSDPNIPLRSLNPDATPEQLAKAVCTGHAHLRYEVVPGAAHWLHYEQAEAVNKAIRSLLQVTGK